MINNYIRGGQIFLHKIRMLKQVWDKTFITACLIALMTASYLSYSKVIKLDYLATITYIKAYGICIIDDISMTRKPTKTFATANNGFISRVIEAKSIITHPMFKGKVQETIDLLIYFIIMTLSIMLGVLISIAFVWSRFGKSATSKDITRGAKVYSAPEATKLLTKLKKASVFKIGGLSLVKDKETSHILITGKTGSGKSNCMHNLLPQVRRQNMPAIIVDFTGEMVERYYNPEMGDVIINPFDERSRYWDFWSEISETSGGDYKLDQLKLEVLSKAIFTPDDASSDPFWSSSAEVIFKDIVEHLVDQKTLSLKTLNEMIAKMDLKKLGAKLKNTYSAVYLDPSNEKTASSIRATLATNTKPLRYLPEKRSNPFILRDWIKNIDQNNPQTNCQNNPENNRGKFLFLSASPENRDIMRPLVSMWLDIIVNSIMSLGPNQNRRIWLVIDELPALKKIPSMMTALSEFRKYGGCVMTGLQSINQLYKIYGQNDAKTMLDQFDTKFIFRTEDSQFASYICKNFGEIEYTESNENISYGAHEMRDGVNVSKIEKRRLLVSPSDLASLENCEAYVSLPEASVRIVKLKMEFKRNR